MVEVKYGPKSLFKLAAHDGWLYLNAINRDQALPMFRLQTFKLGASLVRAALWVFWVGATSR